jgi:hypothetical protein
MATYFTLTTVIELICFFTASVCLFKDTSIVWRLMVVYLFLTCVTEIGGAYISGPQFSINNHWIYNVFLLCEISFTHLMFFHLLSGYINSKPIIITGLAVVIILYIIETLNHGILAYNNTTYSVMSVFYVLYSFLYFYLLLKDEHYISLKYSSEFWWVVGTLFFYFAATAGNLFRNYLASVVLSNGHHLSYYIFRILNIILYGCWSYSFICRKWLTTISKN